MMQNDVSIQVFRLTSIVHKIQRTIAAAHLSA